MSELTGLELRKAACEAMGWELVPGDWGQFARLHWYIRHNGEFTNNTGYYGGPDDLSYLQHFPAIESDPAVCWPIFLEWAKKHNLEWHMNTCKAHDQFTETHIVLWVIGEIDGREIDVEVESENPCEAIARAIVAVSRKEKE